MSSECVSAQMSCALGAQSLIDELLLHRLQSADGMAALTANICRLKSQPLCATTDKPWPIKANTPNGR